MRRLLPLLAALVFVSTPPSQETGAAAAPHLTQAIELADGTSLTIRYRAVPWTEHTHALGTAAVSRGLKIGSHIVPEGEYTLAVGKDGKGAHRLILADARRGEAMELALRPRAEHARRLEIVLTAGDQDGHGVLRFAFGDHAGRLAITTADPEALSEVTARLRDDVRLKTAWVEVQSILDQTELYMIQNPRGGVPSWRDLLAVDARGHAYIAGGAPKQDPWGHAYVIAPDPDFPNKPFVLSFGPDGDEGTADDISNKTRRKKRTGSTPSSRPSKKR